MNNKYLYTIIIIISIILMIFTAFSHIHQNNLYKEKMQNFDDTTCYLPDGTCIHENPYEWMFYLSYLFQIFLIIIGIVLITSSKNNHPQISKKESDFQQYIKGFNPEEKKVLKTLFDNDGIWQSTLRIKTGMSKGKLSLVLQELENRGHIKREKKEKQIKYF